MKTFYLPIIAIFSIIILLKNKASGQGLCDANNRPLGAIEGAFEIEGNITAGCSPLAIKLHDKSGGTNIRYAFNYDGNKDVSLLEMVENKDSTNPGLFSYANATRVYKILQYGTKNGLPMYSCRTISVSPNGKPFYPSPSNCGPNSLTIEIPIHPDNNFEAYEISWGDNSPKETFSNLPFVKTYNYATAITTRTISINGVNNNLVCSNNSETITLDGKGGQPKINSLEILNGGKQIAIDLQGVGTPLELFARDPTIAANYPANPLMQIGTGKTILDNPFSSRACFTVFYYFNCSKTSGEICTQNINKIEADGLNNYLEWEKYPLGKTNSGFTGIDAIAESFTQTLIKTNIATGQITEITNHIPYTYLDNIDCKVGFCYQLKTEIKGITSGSKRVPYEGISFSEKKCISRDTLKAPAIRQLSANVDENNALELNFSDNSSWFLPKDYFYIYRSENKDKDFKKMDSLTVPSSSYIDNSISPIQKQYFYKINYKDICNSFSEFSPTIGNIFLSTENNNNKISWTLDSPFGEDSIQTYKLIEFDEKNNQPKPINTFLFDQNEYTLKSGDFEEVAKYKIVGISKTGEEKSSNVISIPIAVSYFLPSVFSPNGDGKNDYLNIKGKLQNIKKISFEIFDRWGTLIFTSSDKFFEWDGTLNKKYVNPGSYHYTLIIVTNNDEKLTKKGEINLWK